MGALWESPGSIKDGRGANFDGNPRLILTISFFTFFDLWKVPRGSLERVQAQRRRTGRSQESRSNFFVGPQEGPISKRDPRPTPRSARAGRKRRPMALGKNKGQRFSNPNRSKKKKISDLSRPGPLARRIYLCINDFLDNLTN